MTPRAGRGVESVRGWPVPLPPRAAHVRHRVDGGSLRMLGRSGCRENGRFSFFGSWDQRVLMTRSLPRRSRYLVPPPQTPRSRARRRLEPHTLIAQPRLAGLGLGVRVAAKSAERPRASEPAGRHPALAQVAATVSWTARKSAMTETSTIWTVVTTTVRLLSAATGWCLQTKPVMTGGTTGLKAVAWRHVNSALAETEP